VFAFADRHGVPGNLTDSGVGIGGIDSNQCLQQHSLLQVAN
jgi:hypothetical protein